MLAACLPTATGKLVGMREHLSTTHFSTATLADSGHNQGKLTLMFRAVLLQLAPTQGCQKL